MPGLSTDMQPGESTGPNIGRRLSWALIILLSLAVMVLLVERQARGPAGGDATPIAAGPRSIAVLPFVNMSNDPSQEYFSDGIAAELLAELSRVDKLKVAARTSTFSFKGKDVDIRTIGEQLNVDTVLEGSVRRAGDELRITAQLIDVENGYHLWSGTFDRRVSDIFVIQDEIATAIIDALRVHLGAHRDRERPRQVALDAFDFYLLARHKQRLRTESNLREALRLYRDAVDIDPDFAEAWAGMATVTELLSAQFYGPEPDPASRLTAQELLDRALELDPELADAHATQALLKLHEERPHRALVHIDKAIAGSPSEGIYYGWRANILQYLGRHGDALDAIEEGYRIDPLHGAIRHNLALHQAFVGDPAAARRLAEPGSMLGREVEAWIALRERRWADAALALEDTIERRAGDYDLRLGTVAALNYLLNLYNEELAIQHSQGPVRLLTQVLRDPAAALQELQALPAEQHNTATRDLTAMALADLGRCAELLDLYDEAAIVQQPVWGDLASRRNRVQVISAFAWCKARTGDRETARDLARRVETFINTAAENGAPPRYYDELAAAQLLLGQPEKALGSLQLAWQLQGLHWKHFESPILAELRGRQRFRDLQSTVYEHMNAERGKLGWEPVDLPPQ